MPRPTKGKTSPSVPMVTRMACTQEKKESGGDRRTPKLFRELLLGGLAEGGLALVAVAWEAGVLHQPDGDEAALGVDGHVGRQGTAVTEIAAACREAEAPALLDALGGLPARHLLDRGLRQIALALPHAA